MPRVGAGESPPDLDPPKRWQRTVGSDRKPRSASELEGPLAAAELAQLEDAYSRFGALVP